MVINPSLDIWVWVTCLVLLAVLGARAWVVETGQGRLGRTPVKVQVLTGGVVVVLVVLFGLLAMQGGVLLIDSILNGTDPADVVYGQDNADPAAADPGTADPGTADPGAADPGAADPNAPAPPAGQPPAAPPAGGAAGG